MTKLNLNYSYLESTNPCTNLAIENKILVNLAPDSLHILFWVNRPCVVMGRFQNPFLECQLTQMQVDGIDLVRRQSGGGCVYHDLGNLNYSFITNKKNHNKDDNHKIIIDALKTLDINAFSTKRVDLFLSHEGIDKKFSGSAFKEKKDTAFHHGTLLIDSNLDKLNYYLTPKDMSVKSVSIASVRSKVVNLKSINPQINILKVINAIVYSASSYHSTLANEVKDPSIDRDHLDLLENKSWYLGETPKFIIDDLVEGVGHIYLEVKKLKIINLEIESSDLHDSFIQTLRSVLVDESLLQDHHLIVLDQLALDFSMYRDSVETLKKWFEYKFNVLRK